MIPEAAEVRLSWPARETTIMPTLTEELAPTININFAAGEATICYSHRRFFCFVAVKKVSFLADGIGCAVPTFVITSRQIRAARGLIGWTQTDLAESTGLSRSTIAAIEKEVSNPTLDIISRIGTVFENNQIEFLPQEGVRFRHPVIYQDELPEANRRLLEDIYTVSTKFKFKTGVCDILIFGLQEEDAQRSVGDYLTEHIERLKGAGLREKILCGPDTRTFVAPRSWYRRLPELHASQNLIHVYGHKIAIVHWRPKEFVIVIDNKLVANICRAMFYQLWNRIEEDEGAVRA
jgi:transcriptional regulator with XRE-family HTH domain